MFIANLIVLLSFCKFHAKKIYAKHDKTHVLRYCKSVYLLKLLGISYE
jgi:hypothetical protein